MTTPAPYYQDDLVTIYHGSAAEVMATLPEASVDLLFTDPPYPRKFDYVWDDLAIGGARVIRGGGSLLTYLGHYQLPRVMAALLDAGLRYHWLCIQRNAGGINPIMHGFGVKVNYKPLLWFTNGPRAFRSPIMDDDLGRVGKVWAKRFHEWGQPPSLLPILKLTEPGGLVLDPFVGSGSTLIAAKDAGRKSIGIEIEERYCEIAAQRCSQEVLGLAG